MAGQQTSLNQTGKLSIATITRGLPIVCLFLLAAWLVWPGQQGNETAPATDTDTPELQRAAACEGAPLEYLIAHTSDNDWRVRAAAYEALSRIAPIDNAPLRDTPIDQREAVIFDWLDQHAPDLAADLCQVYAQPDDLRFGRTLAQHCLTCHAGPEPPAGLTDQRCAQCHSTIHEQFVGNAHANSLSHLNLITIDPATRQQQTFDFKDRRGLTCITCHQPEDSTDLTTPNDQDVNTCIAPFNTSTCATCHKQAQAEWQTWQSQPRFQKANWPPGSIEQATDDPKSCTDCHMPDGNHLLAARRDPALLQSGLKLAITRDAQGQAVLTLHNLAGHAYPTGTTRRALHLYTQTDDQPETLIAILTDPAPATPITHDAPETSNTQLSLEPNELRRFTLPGRPTHISARTVYVRNRFQPGSYTTHVTSIEHQSIDTLQ